MIFQPVKTAVVSAEADHVRSKRTEGIDARGAFCKIDHIGKREVFIRFGKYEVFVFNHKGADQIARFLGNVFLDGAVTVSGFVCLCVNEIVFHFQNFGKRFRNQHADGFGIIRLCDIGGVDEDTFGRIIGGKRNAVSVHDGAS